MDPSEIEVKAYDPDAPVFCPACGEVVPPHDVAGQRTYLCRCRESEGVVWIAQAIPNPYPEPDRG
jgi:hypothetical protein